MDNQRNEVKIPVYIGRTKMEDIVTQINQKSQIYSRKEVFNIRMECEELSAEERKQIMDLVRKMNLQRKRSKLPRLLYKIKLS